VQRNEIREKIKNKTKTHNSAKGNPEVELWIQTKLGEFGTIVFFGRWMRGTINANKLALFGGGGRV
jgi:hypothetical protein